MTRALVITYIQTGLLQYALLRATLEEVMSILCEF